MRKLILLICCFALTIFAQLSTFNTKQAYAAAQAEISMELSSETILAESNKDMRLPMASTTKILTAIIIIEDCNLDEVIEVPQEATGIEGSSIYLKQGDEINIRDLLYGLMLRSGNDAATALALHHSCSIDKFATVMNERARKMGALNSNFKNPSGLPDDEHYTTAYDLCKIACYSMKNQTFKQIVGTKSYRGKYKSYTNKNKLLANYSGASGIKTGYTLKAGRCFVASAERNNMTVVCVVLNCRDMYERCSELLDDAFNNYEIRHLTQDVVFMCDIIPCRLNKDVKLVVRKNDDLIYKVIKQNSKGNDGVIAILEIYNKNGLLFTEKLFSI